MMLLPTVAARYDGSQSYMYLQVGGAIGQCEIRQMWWWCLHFYIPGFSPHTCVFMRAYCCCVHELDRCVPPPPLVANSVWGGEVHARWMSKHALLHSFSSWVDTKLHSNVSANHQRCARVRQHDWSYDCAGIYFLLSAAAPCCSCVSQAHVRTLGIGSRRR